MSVRSQISPALPVVIPLASHRSDVSLLVIPEVNGATTASFWSLLAPVVPFPPSGGAGLSFSTLLPTAKWQWYS